MTDIFERIEKHSGGPLGQYAAKAFGYYMFPKLEGELGPHMKFQGKDVYGYLDAPKAWGGFGFYFLGSRASAYAKHPDDKAWLFDIDTMKPRGGTASRGAGRILP